MNTVTKSSIKIGKAFKTFQLFTLHVRGIQDTIHKFALKNEIASQLEKVKKVFYLKKPNPLEKLKCFLNPNPAPTP